MDLKKYNPSAADVAALKNLIGYQPYILSDDLYVGVADIWLHGGERKWADRKTDDPAFFERFSSATLRMKRMYDDWVLFVKHHLKGLDGLSVADTACNAGYFLYRFREEGAARATGYDLNNKMVECFKTLNQITGLAVGFHNRGYDMMTHTLPGFEPADIVISTSIMCHLSDPVYYMNFLGSITKKALLLFSTIDDHEQMTITYQEPRKFYNNPFPICFDNMTTVSKPLVLFSLKEAGFQEVIEIPHREEWLPASWYKPFKCYLAIK